MRTQEIFAVKKFSEARIASEGGLFVRELCGLQRATESDLSRVVTMRESLRATNGDRFLVIE